ncbi:PREDICTED: beta-mannosidase-like [Bactrocera latifrons]|uniref:beta-mannosidase n=2 Tax=Bactrocera latifrons TaxID=174628 RepID=A0A0K8W4J5_BACLA|nr:PREDICTED: beta-mannosidase-like [Bactrocera latifrons]
MKMFAAFNEILYAITALFSLTNIFLACGEKVSVVELTTLWTLSNQNGSITKTGLKIPISVYSALSSEYGDVLQSKNDVNLRWIAYDNWTFTKHFNVEEEDFANVNAINLTIYGIDTVSTIRLNGVHIGKTDNMFMRYNFDVLRLLKQENILEIEIQSPIWRAKALVSEQAPWTKTPPECPSKAFRGECHRNMLRKMQMSFGSDVGPAVPSMGIWKTIALEYYEVAILRVVDIAVVPNTTHWIMDVHAFFDTNLSYDFFGNITLFAPDLLDENPHEVGLKTISYQAAKVTFEVPVPKESVKLWWPNGYGDPNLYPIFVSANCWAKTEKPQLMAKTISEKLVYIGFRTVGLVEDPEEGQGRTFYFKVNDVPIFIKGATYLPVDILPEKYDDAEAVEYILRSAHEANMNMIRVWGGGLYESKTFYDTADKLGLLVWQDMTFTNSTYPASNLFLDSIRVEASQNAKFLASHPSLILIVTNDEIELFLVTHKNDFGSALEYERLENEYKQLFMGTIKPELNVISRNSFDPRPGPMISTPSKGIEENKKDLPLDLQSINYGDVHFWEEDIDGCDPDIYPRARFVSEYGFQSMPAITSWNLTMTTNDTIADLIKHRQHDPLGMTPMLQLIERHIPFRASSWEQDINDLVYFSQLTQAMAVKTGTDLFRSQSVNRRTMGALYWHLNDVWVAPTWSSIDYYGNFKLLYYWSKEFFAPLYIVALNDANNESINITLIREEYTEYSDARKYVETINFYYWDKLISRKSTTRDEVLETNSAQTRSVPLDEIISSPFTVNNCFLEFTLSNTNGDVLASTFFLPTNMKNIVGITDPEITVEISWRYCNEDALSLKRQIAYSLLVRIKSPALYVFIQIVHPQIKRYKLSHNGFIQADPVRIVHLEYEHPSECMSISNENIKVQTMNQYLLADAAKKAQNATSARRRRRRKLDL